MPRNAFGDDDSAWSLPTTNAPWGSPGSPGPQETAQPHAPFRGQSEPENSSGGGGPSWGYQQPGSSDTSASPFGGATGPGAFAGGVDVGENAPIGAPGGWLAAAAASVLLGAALGLAAREKPVLSVVGWLLAGAVAIGLLAVFTLRDTRRRASIWYTANESIALVRNTILALAVLAVAINAWQFADWAARR